MRSLKRISEDARVAFTKALEDTAGITDLKTQIEDLGAIVRLNAKTIEDQRADYNQLLAQYEEQQLRCTILTGRIECARQALNP